MTFDDLPDDLTRRPLTDPDLLADAFDLFLRISDRERGAVLALVADTEARLVAPLVVQELPVGCDEWQVHELVNRLADVACHLCPGGGLAVAVGRRGALVHTSWDDTWRRALHLACEEAHLTPLGSALATPAGVMLLDADVAAA